MNQQLTMFEGHQVMILLKQDVNFDFEGDFLIHAGDVANVLEYVRTENVYKHCKPKHIYTVKNEDISASLIRRTRKLNNFGEKFILNLALNRILGKSEQPKAEPFQDWLYEDMLPTIQKTGSYSVNSASKWRAIKESIKDKIEIRKELGMSIGCAQFAAIKNTEKEFGVDLSDWLPGDGLTDSQRNGLLVLAGLYEYDDNGKIQLTEIGKYYGQFRTEWNMPWQRYVWDRIFPGIPYLLKEENALDGPTRHQYLEQFHKIP